MLYRGAVVACRTLSRESSGQDYYRISFVKKKSIHYSKLSVAYFSLHTAKKLSKTPEFDFVSKLVCMIKCRPTLA